MKPLYRCPLIKKIAIAGLSFGSVGSLVYCSASGGGSGESDNDTVETVWLVKSAIYWDLILKAMIKF